MGANNGLDGVLTMVAAPSVFFNECEISFKFDWRSEAELPSDINVQVRNNIFLVHHIAAVCVWKK